MSKINKAELIRRVAQDQGVPPELVGALMDSTFNEIEKALTRHLNSRDECVE